MSLTLGLYFYLGTWLGLLALGSESGVDSMGIDMSKMGNGNGKDGGMLRRHELRME